MSLRPPIGGKTQMGKKGGLSAVMQQLQFDDDTLEVIIKLTESYYKRLSNSNTSIDNNLISDLTRDFHAFLLRQIELEFEYDENEENNNGAEK